MNCAVPGCTKRRQTRSSMCSMHRGRWERYRTFDKAPVFDIGPLDALVMAKGGPAVCAAGNRSLLNDYLLYRDRGTVAAVTADRLAVRMLGCHPSEIWGEAWWAA